MKKIQSAILPAFLAAVLLFCTACSNTPATSSSSSSVNNVSSSTDSVESEASKAESESTQEPSESAESEAPSSDNPASETPIETPAGVLPESERVNDSYFDDAVFIGDSVSLKLNLYTANQRKSNANFLGKAQFLTAGSMGSGNALEPVSDESIHPSYNGQKMSLADAVAKSGAKKVYIMLGMNDLAIYGVDGAAENMQKLIATILEKTPDAKIFIESATPLVKAKNISSHKLNNTNMAAYNQKLIDLCAKEGYYYVDIASVVTDSEGNLIQSYCSDPDNMGIHFTDEGCKVWVDYLYTHAAQ